MVCDALQDRLAGNRSECDALKLQTDFDRLVGVHKKASPESLRTGF